MPQKVLRFTGINRDKNEFQCFGECEELINLRPKIDGGYEIVKPKKTVKEHNSFSAVYEHIFGDVSNVIIVYSNTKSTSVAQYILDEKREIQITSASGTEVVEISFAGNVLLIYWPELKKQEVYKFKDGEYKKETVSVQGVKEAKVVFPYADSTGYMQSNSAVADEDSAGAVNKALQSAASGFYEKYNT